MCSSGTLGKLRSPAPIELLRLASFAGVRYNRPARGFDGPSRSFPAPLASQEGRPMQGCVRTLLMSLLLFTSAAAGAQAPEDVPREPRRPRAGAEETSRRESLYRYVYGVQ